MATLLAPQDSTNMAQAQWQELFMSLFSNGVLGGQLNQYNTTTTSGLGISVASGKAIIQGFLARSDAAVALTAATADPSNPRIDRAVLHADLSAHTLTVQMLTGTPAPSPSPPALSQTSTIWEISLYQVRVNAGSTTITSLTDERAYVVPNIPSGGIVGAQLATATIPDAAMANQKVNRAGDTINGQLVVKNSADPILGQLPSAPGGDTGVVDANVVGDSFPRVGLYVRSGGSGGVRAGGGATPTAHMYANAFGWVVDENMDVLGTLQHNGNSVVEVGAGNLASLPVELIVVGPSSANLPAAGVKGRVAIVVPFALP